MLSTEVVHDPEHLVALREEWEALLGRSGIDCVYLTHEWMTAWWRCFGHRAQLFVVLVRDGQSLIGIAPMMIARDKWRGVPARYLRFISYPLADRCDFIVGGQHAQCIAAIMGCFFDRAQSWDMLSLTEVPGDSANLGHVEAYCRAEGARLEKRLCSRPPFVALEGGWERVQAGLSGRHRKRLRVARARLAEIGALRFLRVMPEGGEVELLVKRVREVEQRSWKGERETGFFSRPEQEEFALRLSLAFAAKKWLDVGLLQLDSRLISYRYGFRYSNKFWDYSVAYDQGYREFSPGHVLLAYLVEDSCRLGLAEVDASRSSLRRGHLLEQWPHRSRSHYEVCAFHGAPYSALLGVLEARIKPVVRRLVGRS